jgi:ParB-like chromosome segregation protein Spo0J
MATTKSSTVTAAPSATPAEAFFDIPLSLITVAGQIRSRIDQEGEAFLALVESIREKGVLESVIVTPRDGNYLLIAGERRLLACQKLALPTIPARVIDVVSGRNEVLALQLTENLQRADLDPIDTAQAVVGFIKVRHGDEAFDIDGIINTMINLERDPARVKKEVADTVSAIMNISGKSLRSVQRSCLLLNLPEEIQNAIREGLIGVSQGYIFAANLDHPLLMEIFQKAIGEGFTNAGLEKELKKGLKPATTTVRKKSFSLYRGSIQSLMTSIDEPSDAFRKSDLEALLNDLRELITVVEGRLPEAIDDGGPAVGAPQKKAVLM